MRVSVVDVWGRTVWSQTVTNARELAWDGIASDGHAIAHSVYIARMVALDANHKSVSVVEKKINYAP
jgi:hypothetical protein